MPKQGWVLLGVTVLLVLAGALPAVPRPKARGSRIQAVNSVPVIAVTLPLTNATPGKP